MKRIYKKSKLLLIIGIFLLAIAFLSYYLPKYFQNRQVIEEKNQKYDEYVVDKNSVPTPGTVDNTTSGAVETIPETVVEKSLPSQASIYVPFQVQAPNANWDATHEEACEETSLIMVYHAQTDTKISGNGETEILKMIEYESTNDIKPDVTVTELEAIAVDYLGLKTGRVVTDATVDDIKREIASGRPVIVPAAGKVLPNPNFRNGGPLYHMLVVKGYDANGFITNDPGTRNGEGFRYTFDSLFNAIHDWDASDIFKGGKNYLVFD